MALTATSYAAIICVDHGFGSDARGRTDRIVQYDKALATLREWGKKGKPIEIITVPGAGHRGVIHWYKRHFEELLLTAEQGVLQL